MIGCYWTQNIAFHWVWLDAHQKQNTHEPVGTTCNIAIQDHKNWWKLLSANLTIWKVTVLMTRFIFLQKIGVLYLLACGNCHGVACSSDKIKISNETEIYFTSYKAMYKINKYEYHYLRNELDWLMYHQFLSIIFLYHFLMKQHT